MKKILILIWLFSMASAYCQSPIEIDKCKMREQKQIKILTDNPNDIEARLKLIQTYFDHGMQYSNVARNDVFRSGF